MGADRVLMGCVISALLFLSAVPLASARPFRMGNLPDRGSKFGCGTCHVNPAGGGSRNPFGADYEKIGLRAGDKYTRELGQMDSDEDAFANDEEFAGGSHPGDPESKPKK